MALINGGIGSFELNGASINAPEFWEFPWVFIPVLSSGDIGSVDIAGASINAPDIWASLGGTLVEFEQSVKAINSGDISFEQAVGVSFDGVVLEFLQNVRLNATGGGLGSAVVEFTQQVRISVGGDFAAISQMVVDDA